MMATSGGFELLHDTLTVPPVHIPDGRGGAYKTELVVERTPERTIKILWWHADDPRSIPHNHPWDFQSEILVGGYTEDRYRVDDGQVVHTERTFRAGAVNAITRAEYHGVRDVLPGTVTRLTCGPAAPGNEWHYLDTVTLERLEPNDVDPGFIDKLHAINPHLAAS